MLGTQFTRESGAAVAGLGFQTFRIMLPVGVPLGHPFNTRVPDYQCTLTLPFPSDKIAGMPYVFQVRRTHAPKAFTRPCPRHKGALSGAV